MTVRSIFCCVPAGAPSGGRSYFGGGPFLPPGAPRRVEGILMDPATSTKTTCMQLFLFYSTAGTVMQVFFYKTVTFWGCVDEVTEFRCCFWLFCTKYIVYSVFTYILHCKNLLCKIGIQIKIRVQIFSRVQAHFTKQCPGFFHC